MSHLGRNVFLQLGQFLSSRTFSFGAFQKHCCEQNLLILPRLFLVFFPQVSHKENSGVVLFDRSAHLRLQCFRPDHVGVNLFLHTGHSLSTSNFGCLYFPSVVVFIVLLLSRTFYTQQMGASRVKVEIWPMPRYSTAPRCPQSWGWLEARFPCPHTQSGDLYPLSHYPAR